MSRFTVFQRNGDFMLYRLWPLGTRVEWHDDGSVWRRGVVIRHEDTHGRTTPSLVVRLDHPLGRGRARFDEIVVWSDSELRHEKRSPT